MNFVIIEDKISILYERHQYLNDGYCGDINGCGYTPIDFIPYTVYLNGPYYVCFPSYGSGDGIGWSDGSGCDNIK